MELSNKNKLKRAEYEILNSDSLAYISTITLDCDSFSCPVFHFSVFPQGHKEKNRDITLGVTLRSLLGSFVGISPYPIMLLYSDDRKRQLVRRRLFDRWFKESDLNGYIKRDVFFGPEDNPTCFSLICKEADIRLDEIMKEVKWLLN